MYTDHAVITGNDNIDPAETRSHCDFLKSMLASSDLSQLSHFCWIHFQDS